MAPKTVLIYTVRNDSHAEIVTRALTMRGSHVIRWIGQDYPERATKSIMIDGVRVRNGLRVGDEIIDPADIEVAWFRRHMRPQVPHYIDERDAEFVSNELQVADAAHPCLIPNAFWINKRVASRLCDIKVRQLLAAQQVGLVVPRTLISNDPHEIKDFISTTSSCIYKPLTGHVWKDGEVNRKTYTSEVELHSLPGDRTLQASPGIFQKKVKKSYEVRAQFFGSFCAAVRIDSLALKGGDLDWRIDQNSITRCEPVELPRLIYGRCRELMAQLDIVSGGFDFIVDKDGEWVFLEVNEAGQFLFLETWCRELPLLDAFCQFVEAADADFIYRPVEDPLRLEKVRDMAIRSGSVT
ncbi:MvdC/MvdD family ATP grasp protein [Stenotrophomonas acidaminiphila]|uniref:MvdC/MvdD family ATP grasp protein n=1 Tax=Stenotrophomonas acidaminiphila TaxID=128780 RepID=UPI0031F33641